MIFILTLAIIGIIIGLIEHAQYGNARSLIVFSFLIAVVAGVELVWL